MKALELLIAEGEGLTVEFKEKYSSKIAQDIVAFSNTKGGTILLGLTDKGDVLGEKLTNALKSQIIDLGRNCKPAIVVQIEKLSDKVIAVHIPEGQDKPHMCSDGFFKRFDALTQKLTPSEVRDLFRNSAAVSFESNANEHAEISDLSLTKINNFLAESHSKLIISSNNVRNFLENIKLVNKNNKLTIAAILMFANDIAKFYHHSQIFLVAYKGTEGVQIYDKKYVRDDLLTQYNEALLFCEKHLNIRTDIVNGKRTDSYEIPMNAIRETIANAIIHRDYSMTGTNIQVEIHYDRLVISNPGGLPEGYDLAKLGTKSFRRNEIIADLFSRMDKAERFGSGIKRVKQLLKEAHCDQPKYESDMFFTVTLNRPEQHRGLEQNQNLTKINKVKKTIQAIPPKSKKKSAVNTTLVILELLERNPKFSQEKIASKINLSVEGVRYQIKKLQKQRKIIRVGSRKTGTWKVLK